jgi:hypothetical protein
VAIERVYVQFNRPVTVSNTHFSMMNVITGQPATMASGTFEYDPATFTASWYISGGYLHAGQYILKVTDAVVDAQTGAKLDGEWVNPLHTTVGNQAVSEFPSGNGTAGGNFLFAMTILPGDINRDNQLDWSDIQLINEGYWEILGDFNQDGNVDSLDADDLDTELGSAGVGLQLSQLFMPTDWNDNLSVDVADYQIFTSHYGQQVTPWTNGDANGDGVVNLYDFAILHTTFGLVAVTSTPPPAPPPR